MALPFEGSSPLSYQTETQIAERKAREEQRKREEAAARERMRVQFNRQELQDRVRKNYIEPIQQREANRAGLGQMVTQFARQREEDRQKDIAQRQMELAKLIIPKAKDALLARGTVTPTPEVGVPRPNVAPTIENFPPRERTSLGQDLLRGAGALIAPLAPKSVTDPIADVLGRGARFGLEHGPPGIGYAVPALSQATGINPRIGGFEPLRHGLMPVSAGEAFQQAVEEEGQRMLPAATSPVGIGSAAAFPAATAFGGAAATAGGIGGRLMEQAGFDPRLRVPLGPLGETNLGPRALGEIALGMYGGPGKSLAKRGVIQTLRDVPAEQASLRVAADAVQNQLTFGDKKRLFDLGIDPWAIDEPAVVARIQQEAPDLAAKIQLPERGLGPGTYADDVGQQYFGPDVPTPEEAGGSRLGDPQEISALHDFLANAPKEGGQVPAAHINPSLRDEQFAQLINSGAYWDSLKRLKALEPSTPGIGKVSSIAKHGFGSMESVQEAIATGRHLGYSDADIAAYLRRNYKVPERGLGPGTYAPIDEGGSGLFGPRTTSEVPPVETTGGQIDPGTSLTRKMIDAAKLARSTRHLVKAEQKEARIAATKAFREELVSLTDQGMPLEEAMPLATARLGGKQSSIVGPGFDVTQAERDWFKDRLLSIPEGREYTMKHIYDAVYDAANGRLPLPGEQAVMADTFGKEFSDAVLTFAKNSKTPGFDPLAFISDLTMTPVTIKSAGDASNMLRQNYKLGLRHPKEWALAAIQGAKATRSDEALGLVEQAFKDDPFEIHIGRPKTAVETRSLDDVARDKELLDIHRLLATDPKASFDPYLVHENFASRLASQVPGVSHSARFFVTNGNAIRRAAVKPWIELAYKKNLAKYGKEFITPEELKDLGDVMRRGSGLGEIGAKTSWLRELVRHLMWAPGLRTSGPQLLWRAIDPRGIILPKNVPILGRGTEPIARRAAIEMIGSWVAAGTAAMSLASLAGMTVITDPLHTNFGTVSIPGSRIKYNVWGPDTNLAWAVARVTAGRAVDEFGNQRDLRPDKAIEEYLMSGLNPAIGSFRDIRRGHSMDKEYTGWNPESAKAFIQDQFPIFLMDLQDSIRMGNPYELPISVPLAFMGLTEQIYPETSGKFRSMPKYRTDLNRTQLALPGAREPLDLTANEEREAQDTIGEVADWINSVEKQYSTVRPQDVPYEEFIKAYGRQKGMDQRDIAAAIFVYKAQRHPEWLSPEWIMYALEHEGELSKRYPDLYSAQYMDRARAVAQEKGLIPR